MDSNQLTIPLRMRMNNGRKNSPCKSFVTRACLKKAFCKMCVTICGRFCSDEGVVAGYDNRIRAKSPAKWGVQIAGMIFQTRSKAVTFFSNFYIENS